MAELRRSFGNTTQIGKLLDRINAGDKDARAEVLREAHERLRRLASKMLNQFSKLRNRGRAETELVLDDGLLDLHKAFDQIQFESPQEFIRRAANRMRSTLLDLVRKHRRELQADKRAVAPDDRLNDAESSDVFSMDEMEAFHDAAGRLPEVERKVFDLRWYLGMSRQETARTLNVEERTVTRHYGKAQDSLAQMLTSDVMGHPS